MVLLSIVQLTPSPEVTHTNIEEPYVLWFQMARETVIAGGRGQLRSCLVGVSIHLGRQEPGMDPHNVRNLGTSDLL